MATTPWGKATVLEEVSVKQAGARTFATIVQLLEGADGDLFVRFAYSTGGTARRGPITLRGPDLDRLKKALARTPALRGALAGFL